MPFGEVIAFEVTTGWTNESGRPLQLKEVISAGRLGSKSSLELYQRHFLIKFFHGILLSR
jgi:hypothetical protein